MMRLKQLAEVTILMIVLRYSVVGLQGCLELLECLEHVASLEIIEQEELVTVQRV